MRLVAAIAGLTLLASTSVTAQPLIFDRAAQATNPPLQILNLTIVDDVAANTTFNFTAYNPDPLSNAVANCSGTWPHGSPLYPQGGHAFQCDNSTFAWHFDKPLQDIRKFTIDLQHMFNDPAVGDPPYDRVTVFGRADISESNVKFNTVYGKLVGTQSLDPILLPIYATMA
ncbi:uncharacterized protein MYCFIDRAFT_88546 [Pseudocercospora fijiensis CIRAD86]|uniref:Uncharacterized protein n=1 Tax=Pseudocercospora fijiensis (strain CIRAD86) TaxID=383855 RepID=M2Z6S0_PSEFD|nr:uncharacterized protein MYCFIDRAFT_88546 [Pseudocercospora fijiensis CIRAD86]EME85475.1 hypothetical protein MYCFIDRAFT_88546 [Pseudocercospora fijiensis CIRAD86]